MIDRRTLIKSGAAVAAAALVRPSRTWAAGAQPIEFKPLSPLPVPETTVDVTAFGAKPGSGADATAAFRAAAIKCQELKRARLLIPAGEYDFKDGKAIQHLDDLMAGKLRPDQIQFGQNIDYARAIEFNGLDGLLVDGAGARLRFHGLTQPLLFQNCANTTVRGISIDWNHPLYAIAEVTKSSAGELEIKPDDATPLRGGEPAYVFMPFDRQTGDLGSFEAYSATGRIEAAANGRFRIRNPLAFLFKPGTWIVIRHIIYRPGIHAYGGSDLRMEDVNLSWVPSFGMVIHRVNGVALDRVKVAPSGGLPMTLNGDASHFISCRGEVRLTGCEYARMGDDGLNIHGFYQIIKEKVDARTLVCTNAHLTQDLMPDFPDSGDEIELVRPWTLFPYWSARAVAAVTDPATGLTRITLDRDLPWNFRRSDYLQDVSQLAALLMRDCRVFNTRARAALVQTRGALIEGCLFERNTGTGVHVNTAISWMESGGTRDVTIRNNKIIGCGFGPGAYEGVSGICVSVEAPLPRVGVHRRLTIADNEIDAGGRKAIQLSCVDDVLLTGNRIRNARPVIGMRAATNVRKA